MRWPPPRWLRWAVLKKVLGIVFLVLVAVLIIMQARKIEWAQVGAAAAAYRPGTLALAVLLSALSYSIYSCFDLISRRYVGSPLSRRLTMAIAFTSYAFNQNFGYLVGGLAFRFRLYSRFGLDNAQISRIVALSVVTNWLGYAIVAGVVFALGFATLPPNWRLSSEALRLIGVALLVMAGGYFALTVRRHKIVLRKLQVELPSLRVVLVQLLLSITHWPLAAAVIYVLLQHRIDYLSVLSTMLLSSIAAVVAHVPAGLGVIEAMFIAVLGSRVSTNELLAALLVYRAAYHLLPLAAAGLVFVGMETQAKREHRADDKKPLREAGAVR